MSLMTEVISESIFRASPKGLAINEAVQSVSIANK